MGMEGTGLTVADAIALRESSGDDMFGSNGMGILFLFFLLAAGGNSFGFGGNNRWATQGDVQRGFDNQSVINKLNGLENGLCDGFYAQNTTMLQGFNGMQRDLMSAFSALGSKVDESRFAAQQCCCETNRNIDAVRYENAKNTCDIMQNADRNTQRILDAMTQNTIQELRDKASTYEFQLSQQAQTANLISQLRPCPVPAYLSCSPYTSFGPQSSNWGCGCGVGTC